jgi:hypothetical protein
MPKVCSPNIPDLIFQTFYLRILIPKAYTEKLYFVKMTDIGQLHIPNNNRKFVIRDYMYMYVFIILTNMFYVDL